MIPTPFLWYELPYPKLDRDLVLGLCTRDPKEDSPTSRAGICGGGRRGAGMRVNYENEFGSPAPDGVPEVEASPP